MAYRLRPYLANATEEQLRARLDDICRNIYAFTSEAKLGVISPEDGGLIWSQKLTDLNLEFYRRGLDTVSFADLSDMPWKREALELIRRNEHLVPYLGKTGVFCKFGKIEHMRPLLGKGAMRLSPASFYHGSEHNAARRDNELVLHAHITPYDYDLGLIPAAILAHLPSRSWVTIKHAKPSNHYLNCMTVSFDFRYFFDFGNENGPANACVLIHDQAAFEDRLFRSVTMALPHWRVRSEMVKYVDPHFLITELPSGDDIYFIKSFRFLYQREYRLAAIPQDKNAASLGYLPLELGPLNDIAELLVISP